MPPLLAWQLHQHHPTQHNVLITLKLWGFMKEGGGGQKRHGLPPTNGCALEQHTSAPAPGGRRLVGCCACSDWITKCGRSTASSLLSPPGLEYCHHHACVHRHTHIHSHTDIQSLTHTVTYTHTHEGLECSMQQTDTHKLRLSL